MLPSESIPFTRKTIPLTENELHWQVLSVCERAAAGLLFAAALPVISGSAFLVWVFSGRTPVIVHKRVGWQGANLWMLKLRTMWNRSAHAGTSSKPDGWIEYIDDEFGPDLKGRSDPRVSSSFARFLRSHSIDELPQLWHVISGEMSLVGPRPMTRRELRRHYSGDADEVLSVKPGLVGLWQISGHNRLSYAERCQLDLKLVRDRNLKMYFNILFRTVIEVVRGENTW